MSMGQATGPIYTCETTGHAPAAVLDAHPERRRGTVSGQSAPNPMRCVSSCCQPSLSSPLDGMQANSKPLVSSTLHMHKPPLWCTWNTASVAFACDALTLRTPDAHDWETATLQGWQNLRPCPRCHARFSKGACRAQRWSKQGWQRQARACRLRGALEYAHLLLLDTQLRADTCPLRLHPCACIVVTPPRERAARHRRALRRARRSLASMLVRHQTPNILLSSLRCAFHRGRLGGVRVHVSE